MPCDERKDVEGRERHAMREKMVEKRGARKKWKKGWMEKEEKSMWRVKYGKKREE